jgi:hypothetical protein
MFTNRICIGFAVLFTTRMVSAQNLNFDTFQSNFEIHGISASRSGLVIHSDFGVFPPFKKDQFVEEISIGNYLPYTFEDEGGTYYYKGRWGILRAFEGSVHKRPKEGQEVPAIGYWGRLKVLFKSIVAPPPALFYSDRDIQG